MIPYSFWFLYFFLCFLFGMIIGSNRSISTCRLVQQVIAEHTRSTRSDVVSHDSNRSSELNGSEFTLEYHVFKLLS